MMKQMTQENIRQAADDAFIRANLYRVAAAFFNAPPTEEMIAAMRDNPLAPVQVSPDWKLDELVQGFHDLFHVPTGYYVFPYESCYRSRTKDNKPGSLMGQYTIQVRELYERAGFEVGDGVAELPDHAGIEFAMVQKFTELEAEAWEREDEESAQAWHRYQQALIGKHMVHWIPALCAEIEDKAPHDYYKQFSRWVRRLMTTPGDHPADGEFLSLPGLEPDGSSTSGGSR